MPDREAKTESFSFANRGIVQKVEPGSLDPTQFRELRNVRTDQEGSIRVTRGSHRYPNPIPTFGVIHSIAKMGVNGGTYDDKFYVGEGTRLWRVTGSGFSSYTDVSPANLFQSPVRAWEAAAYSEGTSGRPRMFFATKDGNRQDDGTSAKLRPWGILPPARPATLGLADPTLSGANGLVVLSNQESGGSSRLSTSVSSSTLVGATGSNYYRITPASMTGILPGMYLKIATPGYVLVDYTDATGFYAYCSSAPSGAIDAFYKLVDTNEDGSPIGGSPPLLEASGTNYYGLFAGSADWAFQGDPTNGYDSDDVVNIGLMVTDADDGSSGMTCITEIRVRVYVGGSSVDYYEKAFIPPQTLAFLTNEETSSEAQEARADLIAAAALGQTGFPDVITSGLRPVELRATANATWAEYGVRKSSFLKVGNAGNGATSWKNVTSVQVFVRAKEKSTLAKFDVQVGSIYAKGGQGPDSESVPTALPYDYVYTHRDPVTGAEGNPSAILVENRHIRTNRRAVAVTVYGTSTDADQGNPNITGYGSIAVYRRGGTFADGFFRFLGYAANPGVTGSSPGVPNAVVFVDNNPDAAIAANRIAEFDNDAPVTSDLPTAFAGKIASLAANGEYTRVLLGDYPGIGSDPAMSTFFSDRARIRIGKGTNEETCVILAVGGNIAGGTNWVEVFLQQTHVAGEQVECSAKVGQPCDIICRIGDSVLLSGDVANPHKVYRSKSGRPGAFPVINEVTQQSHQIIVGSPSNPINGMADFDNEVVCLNRSSIYTFSIWGGQMSQPRLTPATRGLYCKHAWCRVDNAIWYLSHDGIYSWQGGASTNMSEAIKFVFSRSGTDDDGAAGDTVNNLAPMDWESADDFRLAFHDNHVWFVYQDTDGYRSVLIYSLLYQRWEHRRGTISDIQAILTFYADRDRGRLYAGVYDIGVNKGFLYQMDSGTTEGWSSTPGDGTALDWVVRTGNFSPGERLLTKNFNEIALELENPVDSITVRLFYDFSSTADPIDVFTISPAAGRRMVPLPLQVVGGIASGKEARSISLELSGESSGLVTMYSAHFTFIPQTEITRGRATDWMDCGHKWDKRFYTLNIEFDTGGQNVTLNLDQMTGLNGTLTSVAQTFSLNSSGRVKRSFPISDGIVAKMVRLRPTVPVSTFRIFDVSFEKENYPPDCVGFTEYIDKGYALEKYIQRILLDVNTNNVTTPVVVEADGVAVQTINVTGTLANRNQKVTLNPAITAKRLRLLVQNPTASTYFQLFGWDYEAVPADKGAIDHSHDWDDLGHPYDKKLSSITFEYDNTGGAAVTIQMDIIYGLGGTTQQIGALTFTLTGGGRSKQQFGLADGVIVKMIRIRPTGASNPVNFRIWGYKVDKVDYPADVIRFIEWEDFGYEHEKILQEIALDINTNGVPCDIVAQADSLTLQTYSVTSTVNTREQIVTLNKELRGKKFRLLFNPGSGGMAQFWNWKPKFLKGDPGPVEHTFDWDDLGHPFDKRLFTVTFEYDTGNIPMVMEMDTLTGPNGTQQNLAVQQFTLSGNGRSKQTFAITIDTIVKMVRIHPASSTNAPNLRTWRYTFDKQNMPADVVKGPEWSDLGWPCEKILRSLTVDADTGGVETMLHIHGDGAVINSQPITTTVTDRVRILTMPSDLIVKLVRVVPVPGAGGKYQKFAERWDALREPCYLTHWDSYEVVLGEAGWRFKKQIWLEYICAGQIRFTIYRDGKTPVHQVDLPAHTKRDVERFFLRRVGNLGGLNKSKVYRFTIDSLDLTKPFKFYRDGGRIESKTFGGDMRQAYAQHLIWTNMAPEV